MTTRTPSTVTHSTINRPMIAQVNILHNTQDLICDIRDPPAQTPIQTIPTTFRHPKEAQRSGNDLAITTPSTPNEQSTLYFPSNPSARYQYKATTRDLPSLTSHLITQHFSQTQNPKDQTNSRPRPPGPDPIVTYHHPSPYQKFPNTQTCHRLHDGPSPFIPSSMFARREGGKTASP